MIPSTLCKLIQMCSIIVFFRLVPIAQDVFFLDAARRCMLDRNLKAKLFQALGKTPFDTVKESLAGLRLGERWFKARDIIVFQRETATLLFIRRSRGRLSFIATYSTFCYIDHTVAIE